MTEREAYRDPYEPIYDPSQDQPAGDPAQPSEPSMPDPFPGSHGDDDDPIIEMPIPGGDQSF